MVFPSPLCAIEVFAVGFIMIHQYVWLSFTIFSLLVGNFLEFLFLADCSRIVLYCRIFHSWRFFVCCALSSTRMFTIRTMAPANYENCPQSLLNTLLWMYSSPWPSFAKFKSASELTTVQSIHHLLLREIVKNMSFTWVIEAMALGGICFPYGVLAAFPCVSRIWCFGIVDLRQSFWSKSAPVVTRVAHFGTSEAESHRNLPPL